MRILKKLTASIVTHLIEPVVAARMKAQDMRILELERAVVDLEARATETNTRRKSVLLS